MSKYTVSGWNDDGMVPEREVTSLKAARRVAAEMRGVYDPRDTSVRVRIVTGHPDEADERLPEYTVALWGGTDRNRWERRDPSA